MDVKYYSRIKDLWAIRTPRGVASTLRHVSSAGWKRSRRAREGHFSVRALGWARILYMEFFTGRLDIDK
jgi:hypothetical protein